MPKLTHLDVLIVYNGGIATSASNSAEANTTPFVIGSRHDSCNTAYSYFLEICQKLGLKAALSTSSDIMGAGLCQSYWTYHHKKWHKINSHCYCSLIFDKFSPTTKQGKIDRALLFSSSKVLPYTNPALFNLFFDKQKTYDTLALHSIPTISLKSNSPQSIQQSCRTLAKLLKSHPGSADFSRDIIMKDRFGAGGNHVYKFKSGQSTDMALIMQNNAATSFIIQPFAKFDQGYSYDNGPASTDIRLIYLGNKIIESYIRVAKADDFRCNQHQGGTLTYLPLKDIPQSLLTKSDQIGEILDKQPSLYSLDFIISNNGNPYFLEGNTGPGLDWNLSVKKEEINAKKFIRTIVKSLSHDNNTPPSTTIWDPVI